MIVIRNNILPFGKSYGAINLFGVLFAKRNMPITPAVLNHELIHTAQMREMLFVPFYIVYVLEWLCRLFQHHFNGFDAYMDISFEREAYRYGNNLRYLKSRKRFAQWRGNE